MRERGQVQTAVGTVVDAFGAITRLVCNAGIVTMTSFDELTDEEWDLVLDVNLKGQWLVIQEVAPTMAEAMAA